MTAVLIVIVVLLVLGLVGAASSVRILREYERGVVFRLGRLLGEKGPGLVILIPGVDRMVRVELRTVTLNIPPQDLITRDNVPARVNAVGYFRVVDPVKAVNEVEQFQVATSQISQTTLRSVLGRASLDMLLAERDKLNDSLQQIIDDQTEPWGVKVTTVEIKDVEIPSNMQRAMAAEAEAERERRAKVINAEGEFQASERLFDAAEIISKNPAALQLRYLQTLGEIGVNQNSTVVFPLPMDLVQPFLEGAARVTGGDRGEVEPEREPPSTPALDAGPDASALPPSRAPADTSSAAGNGEPTAVDVGPLGESGQGEPGA